VNIITGTREPREYSRKPPFITFEFGEWCGRRVRYWLHGEFGGVGINFDKKASKLTRQGDEYLSHNNANAILDVGAAV
jgi:hypothetical protein